MHATNRNLLALALCAAFAAPALAADNPQAATKKPATAATSTDAVSARATTREAGRMMAPKVSPQVQAAASAKAGNPGKGNWWADADIDGDGQLSAAEAKANAGLNSRFVDIDADADGYVTNDEYRHFFTTENSQGEAHAAAHSSVVTRDVWTKLDANSDGKLSSGEVTSNTSLSGAFATMDSNGDGFVTQAEYTAYAKAHLK